MNKKWQHQKMVKMQGKEVGQDEEQERERKEALDRKDSSRKSPGCGFSD